MLTPPPTPSILISAGEASGDAHGANLVKALFELSPNACIHAMGSQKMKDAGATLLFDSRSIAVVGLVEVLKHWGMIKTALKKLQSFIEATPPDILVLVDYAEFNLKLAKFAKSKGVKVLFFISPQVWAWRSHRVKKIGAVVDHMAVIFPFETEIYEKNNIPVSYVGHPLAEKVHPSMPVEKAKQQFGLSDDKATIGLLPGSRKSEIDRLFPILLASAHRLLELGQSVQFLTPVAPFIDKSQLEAYLSDFNKTHDVSLGITFTQTDYYDAINCCDAVIVASGTASLEVALLEKPFSVVYKTQALSYAILKRLIEIDHICLANIIFGKKIVPEFIQHDATADNLSQEVIKQLTDTHYTSVMQGHLKHVSTLLGQGGSIDNVAQLTLSMLKSAD